MTQDAEKEMITVKEQGAWLQVNVGKADAPKLMRIKLTPADFEELNRINSKIIEASGKAGGKGKEGAFNNDLFSKEVVGALAPHVVDWNLHDDNGKIDLTDENKRKHLSRFMTAYVTREAAEQIEGLTEAATPTPKPEGRETVLTAIIGFIGDYSNFLEA